MYVCNDNTNTKTTNSDNDNTHLNCMYDVYNSIYTYLYNCMLCLFRFIVMCMCSLSAALYV